MYSYCFGASPNSSTSYRRTEKSKPSHTENKEQEKKRGLGQLVAAVSRKRWGGVGRKAK